MLKEVILEELGEKLDLNRIHFVGRIPHPYLISLLQVSSVHIYLSYPFVLGWSLLEAMACGCCIVGSEGMPVSEVIENNVEGLLVPMNDHKQLSKRIIYLLENNSVRNTLSINARKKALLWDQNVMLNRLSNFLETIKSI